MEEKIFSNGTLSQRYIKDYPKLLIPIMVIICIIIYSSISSNKPVFSNFNFLFVLIVIILFSLIGLSISYFNDRIISFNNSGIIVPIPIPYSSQNYQIPYSYIDSFKIDGYNLTINLNKIEGLPKNLNTASKKITIKINDTQVQSEIKSYFIKNNIKEI